MKICFILATNKIDVQWNAPLAFGYLKASVDRLVPGEFDFSVARSAADIEAIAPDVLGISSMSQDFDTAMELASAARLAGVPIIMMGGHHITAFPGTLPDTVDLGVLREGEQTFAEIISLLHNNSTLDTKLLSGIPGIVYRDSDGQLITTIARSMVKELDDLPKPDQSFGMATFQKPYMFTSRGCPYQCAFCASSQYWDNTRFHSAERVVDEISGILTDFPGIKSIGFWDDLFAVNRKRVRMVAEMVIEKGYHKKTAFSTSMRSDIVDDELCTLLTSMNLKRIGIGAESGSDPILKKLKNPYSSVEKNQHALDVMYRHGMQPGAGFVFGHYDETEADIHETYRWIMQNYAQGKLTQHEVNILTPMPSTPIWDWALEHGFVQNENMQWHRLRYLTMNANNLDGMDDWIKIRKENKSIYLNEKNVPLELFYEIIEHYEKRIKRGDFGKVDGKRGAGTAMRVRQLKKNAQGKLYKGKVKLHEMRNLKHK